MDFSYSASEEGFRARLRAFLAANPPPPDDGSFAVGLEWQRTLHRGRWVAPHWPVEHGGQGATPVEYAIYVAEMAAVGAPQPANRVAVNMIGPTLLAHGRPDQQERYLGPMVAADEIWCQLFSEPDAGSDLASVRTRAVDDGDDWVVTGQKVWSSFAAEAQLAVLLARTGPDTVGGRGLTFLVCDMRAPGVEVRRIRQLTGEAEFGEVFLDGVRIPKTAVIGAEGAGWAVMQTTLANERGISFPLKEQVQLGVQLRGLIERARAGAVRLPDPLRHRLIDDVVAARIFELLNLRTLTTLARGDDPGTRSSLTKLAFSSYAQHLQVTATAIAGLDAIAGDPSEWRGLLWYRSASIAGGTSEVQRTLVGERLLGLPREPRPPSPGPA